jgi:hypothetical protein
VLVGQIELQGYPKPSTHEIEMKEGVAVLVGVGVGVEVGVGVRVGVLVGVGVGEGDVPGGFAVACDVGARGSGP